MNVNEIKELRASKQNEISTLMGDDKGASMTAEGAVRCDALITEVKELNVELKRAENILAYAKSEARTSTPVVGLGKGEEAEKTEILKRFSLTEAVSDVVRGKGVTGAAAELRQEADSELRGHGLGTSEGVAIPSKFMNDKEDRNFSAGSTEGGETIQTEVSSSVIEALVPQPIVKSLGATELNGLEGNVQLPKIVATPTMAMVAETGASSATPSNPFGSVNMTAKRMSAHTDVSMQLLHQSSVDVELLIASELRRSAERKIDDLAINGDGTGQNPTGILTAAASNTHNFTSSVPTLQGMIAMEDVVANADGLADGSAYLMNPSMYGVLKGSTVDNGSGRFVIDGKELNGYTAARSTMVSDSTDIIFGDFSQLMLGYWGGLDITFDQYTQATSGQVRLVMNRWFDVAVRQNGAFCIAENAILS